MRAGFLTMCRAILFFLLAVSVLFAGAYGVRAQGHAGYCDDTRTTADALDCVNRHKQDVQERLNDIYNRLTADQVEDSIALLGTAQQNWIAYRNAQCTWESALTTNPSLKRIYELSCITLLTNLRADILATTLVREETGEPREFGASPRWMNVLVHDYPDIFWRYGKWLQADLDCDGAEEHVITGVKILPASDSRQEAGLELVVALTKNPVVGRPKPRIFHIPIDKDHQDVGLCNASVTMALTVNPAFLPENDSENVDDDKGAVAPSSCKTALQVIDEVCAPVTLYWTDGDYRLLQPQPESG